MYERMLDKQAMPSIADMAAYCGGNGGLFTLLDGWMSQAYGTERQVVFPYGRKYGWGIAHRVKGKLICNIFAESGAFTVMVRLSDRQFSAAYGQVHQAAQVCIDKRYPCGDGGWIHFRVTSKEEFDDIQKILSVKFAK